MGLGSQTGFRGLLTQCNFSGEEKCFARLGVRSRPTSEAGGEVWDWLDTGGPSKVHLGGRQYSMENDKVIEML